MIEWSTLRRLLLPATVTFVLALLARLPAATVLNWVLPDTVATRGISGTIWNGNVDVVAVEGVAVGPLSWNWRPGALLSGRIGAEIQAGLPGGYFDGVVAVGTSTIVLEDVRALADLEPLTRRSSIGAARGTARVAASHLRLEDLWPTEIEGEVRLSNLRYAATGNTSLGGYILKFDATASENPAFPVAGQLVSDGTGPFEVDGSLALGADRAYALNATVAPVASAPAEISRALGFLPADASGQRLLRFEGTL